MIAGTGSMCERRGETHPQGANLPDPRARLMEALDHPAQRQRHVDVVQRRASGARRQRKPNLRRWIGRLALPLVGKKVVPR